MLAPPRRASGGRSHLRQVEGQARLEGRPTARGARARRVRTRPQAGRAWHRLAGPAPMLPLRPVSYQTPTPARPEARLSGRAAADGGRPPKASQQQADQAGAQAAGWPHRSTSRLRDRSSSGVASTAWGRPQAQPRTTASASSRQAAGDGDAACSAGAQNTTNQYSSVSAEQVGCGGVGRTLRRKDTEQRACACCLTWAAAGIRDEGCWRARMQAPQRIGSPYDNRSWQGPGRAGRAAVESCRECSCRECAQQEPGS